LTCADRSRSTHDTLLCRDTRESVDARSLRCSDAFSQHRDAVSDDDSEMADVTGDTGVQFGCVCGARKDCGGEDGMLRCGRDVRDGASTGAGTGTGVDGVDGEKPRQSSGCVVRKSAVTIR
jgi:hypothetical protein